MGLGESSIVIFTFRGDKVNITKDIATEDCKLIWTPKAVCETLRSSNKQYKHAFPVEEQQETKLNIKCRQINIKSRNRHPKIAYLSVMTITRFISVSVLTERSQDVLTQYTFQKLGRL